MSDHLKEKKRKRKCTVCDKLIGEFGHACNYPGKPKQ